MAFFILPLLSARDLDIGPEGFRPRDDISRGLMTFITYFARADKMLLPFTRGQITCYCPRKMLLPRRQITPQIMLLLHMQILRYFNKICDNKI